MDLIRLRRILTTLSKFSDGSSVPPSIGLEDVIQTLKVGEYEITDLKFGGEAVLFFVRGSYGLQDRAFRFYPIIYFNKASSDKYTEYSVVSHNFLKLQKKSVNQFSKHVAATWITSSLLPNHFGRIVDCFFGNFSPLDFFVRGIQQKLVTENVLSQQREFEQDVRRVLARENSHLENDVNTIFTYQKKNMTELNKFRTDISIRWMISELEQIYSATSLYTLLKTPGVLNLEFNFFVPVAIMMHLFKKYQCVHGDFSPSNIMIPNDPARPVKIIDTGRLEFLTEYGFNQTMQDLNVDFVGAQLIRNLMFKYRLHPKIDLYRYSIDFILEYTMTGYNHLMYLANHQKIVQFISVVLTIDSPFVEKVITASTSNKVQNKLSQSQLAAAMLYIVFCATQGKLFTWPQNQVLINALKTVREFIFIVSSPEYTLDEIIGFAATYVPLEYYDNIFISAKYISLSTFLPRLESLSKSKGTRDRVPTTTQLPSKGRVAQLATDQSSSSGLLETAGSVTFSATDLMSSTEAVVSSSSSSSSVRSTSSSSSSNISSASSNIRNRPTRLSHFISTSGGQSIVDQNNFFQRLSTFGDGNCMLHSLLAGAMIQANPQQDMSTNDLVDRGLLHKNGEWGVQDIDHEILRRKFVDIMFRNNILSIDTLTSQFVGPEATSTVGELKEELLNVVKSKSGMLYVDAKKKLEAAGKTGITEANFFDLYVTRDEFFDVVQKTFRRSGVYATEPFILAASQHFRRYIVVWEKNSHNDHHRSVIYPKSTDVTLIQNIDINELPIHVRRNGEHYEIMRPTGKGYYSIRRNIEFNVNFALGDKTFVDANEHVNYFCTLNNLRKQLVEDDNTCQLIRQADVKRLFNNNLRSPVCVMTNEARKGATTVRWKQTIYPASLENYNEITQLNLSTTEILEYTMFYLDNEDRCWELVSIIESNQSLKIVAEILFALVAHNL